jgi:hypothetical protein
MKSQEDAEKIRDIFVAFPTRLRAADGSDILIWNGERGSVASRLWHMIRNAALRDVDDSKAMWLPNLPMTLRTASVRIVNPENGNRLYVKQYANGQKHVVVVSPDGIVKEQQAFTGSLITQFPKEGNVKIENYRIDWVRPDGAVQPR